MINLDDVEYGIKESERAASLGRLRRNDHRVSAPRYDAGYTASVYHFDVARLTVPA